MGKENGCTCDDPELILVVDQNLQRPYVSGNPHCRFCASCERRYFCKEEMWETADEKFVIPEGEEDPIPVEEYDGEYGNFFECPKCGKPTFGQPDECEDCGAEYRWEDE